MGSLIHVQRVRSRAFFCRPLPSVRMGLQEKSDVTPRNRVASLIHTQWAHLLGLNDVCELLRNHARTPHTCRAERPPSRNGLPYANR